MHSRYHNPYRHTTLHRVCLRPAALQGGGIEMPCNVIVLPNRPSRPVVSEDTAQGTRIATRIPRVPGRLGRSAAGAEPATLSYGSFASNPSGHEPREARRIIMS